MDPVTHTLVGAALAESGLKRRTALGTATLLVGVNLPDVDVLAYAAGPTFALSFRRGWTHGILALVVLPFVLCGLMLAWDRFVRRGRDPDRAPAVPRQLLLLAAVAVLTHPFLDFLNVYGMRWLMPFQDRWFYGDVLFIVDPWLWAVLAGGVFLARRGAAVRPARLALVLAAGYIAVMAAGMLAARWLVWRSLPFARAGVERIMVAPEPITPFRRWVVLEERDGYRVGEFDWWRSPRIRYSDLAFLPRGDDGPVVARARATTEGAQFLSWARFPFFRLAGEAGAGPPRVHLIDARYALEPDAAFGALTVEAVDP